MNWQKLGFELFFCDELKKTLAHFKLSLAVIKHAQLLQKIEVRLKTHQVTTVTFFE